MIEFKPRYFVLPAIALTVLAMLHAPADGGRARRLRGADARCRHPRELRGIPAHPVGHRREGLRHREQQPALIFRQPVKPQA